MVLQLISDKMPNQFKLSFAQWTRAAVRELILRRFKVDMPIKTIGEYLRRWGGGTPLKLLKKACQQKPKLVETWLKEGYRFTGATKRDSVAIVNTVGAMRRRARPRFNGGLAGALSPT